MTKNKPRVSVFNMLKHLPQMADDDLLGQRITQALRNMPSSNTFPQDCRSRPHNMVDRISSDWPKNMDRPKRQKICKRLGDTISKTWKNYEQAKKSMDIAA